MMFVRGRIDAGVTLRDLLEETQRAFVVLPITASVVERSVQFGKSFPSDPADQIIAATAIMWGLKLVTADSQIRKSGEVQCIW